MSPLYPFSNLAINVPIASPLEIDGFGNPIENLPAYIPCLFWVEENTEETKIPSGIRKNFSIGVDAFYLTGHITSVNGDSNNYKLPSKILYNTESIAVHKPTFFNLKNKPTIGKAMLQVTLQPSFNENEITGDNVAIVFTVDDNQELVTSEYQKLISLLSEVNA